MMVEVAIVGAGLSGLALAVALQAEGRRVAVLEARDRPGGRVLSEAGYDLGPAWIWPHNRRMLALIDDLRLRRFPQHSSGLMVFEDAAGSIRRDIDMATMGGAFRVDGGLGRITDALAARVDDLRLGHAVQTVAEDATGVSLSGDVVDLRADRAVLALPPRLASGLGVAVRDVPTWMAGQTKLVARYPTPFWRASGLNGDAMSHRGPLVELHDASPLDGAEGALFGFALPGAARQPEFRAAALAQLGRLFGPEAAHPTDVLIKDWSRDPHTATERDQAPPRTHPAFPPQPSTPRILFAGSEAARTEGGFLEGALEAAEAAQHALAKAAA